MVQKTRANAAARKSVASPIFAAAFKAPNAQGRRKELQAQKRDAILRTAARLFRERGYEQTWLNDIADALNVTKPTLYYYVKNKEDILVQIQQSALDQIVGYLNELIRTDEPGVEILRRVMLRYGEWVTSEFGVCVVRLMTQEMSPRSKAQVRKGVRLTERTVISVIERGMKDGSIRPGDPWVFATAMFGAFNWMAFWYDESRGELSAAELSARYMDQVIHGIASETWRRKSGPIGAPAQVEHGIRSLRRGRSVPR